MLPHFRPVEPPLLFFGRQAVEVLQPLLQLLLLLRRKLPELWRILQCLLLLREREVPM